MAKVYFAADHAAVDLKDALLEYAKSQGHSVVNLGTDTSDSVDYPLYSDKVAYALRENPEAFGVVLCGSGIGVSIAANRFRHIRAALCLNEKMAELARVHNHANVLCLGSKFTALDTAKNMLDIFLNTEPEEGGRHSRRVEMMS